ncbi:MAG: SdrD B-like domain-containing protein, partial [Anaerolineae bacterium]
MKHLKHVIALSTAAALLAAMLSLFTSSAVAAMSARPAGLGVAGAVFFDHDGNGQRDDGDEGLAGVTVILRGRLYSAVTTTDEAGRYSFSHVPSGMYRIVEMNSDSRVSTTPDAVRVVLRGRDRVARVDFGAALPVSMFGAVFRDDNQSGQFDFFESGIEGVDVSVYADADGDGILDPEPLLLARTQTDVQGNYLFTNLPPGKVVVAE